MNPFRHATVLIVLGWYLMTPWPKARGDPSADLRCFAAVDYFGVPRIVGAPLGNWVTVAIFDDEKDCQEARDVQDQIHLSDQAHPSR
jgi:hypothetical protein